MDPIRPRDRLAAVLATSAGLLMMFGAVPHAFFAWPHFRGALEASPIDADVVGAVGAAWRFGSVMMVATGGVVALAGLRAWRGRALDALVIGPIAVAWLGYGIAAMVARDGSPHLLAYVVAGALAVTALGLDRMRRGS
jgi:hypothetical protein